MYYWRFVRMETLKCNQFNLISENAEKQENCLQKLLIQNGLYLHQTDDCALQNCSSLEIIGNVLLLYNSYIEGKYTSSKHTKDKQSIFNVVYCCIDDSYNNSQLLDDFNHLWCNHRHQLHVICDMLQKKIYDDQECVMVDCISYKRNTRDRALVRTKANMLQKLYQTNKDDIVSEQILYRIHCSLLHVNNFNKYADRKQNQYAEENKSSLESDHSDAYANVVRKNRYSLLNEMEQYSFGVTYFYWKNNQIANCGEEEMDYSMEWGIIVPIINLNWYIKSKCINLKQ
eukprot:510812_1